MPSQRGYDIYDSTRQAALEMNPNADEARAAHYNCACCYAKLGEWEKACDSVITAVNDYDLRLIVALKVAIAHNILCLSFTTVGDSTACHSKNAGFRLCTGRYGY
eukprot:scaffold274659_cov20-Prasinocladus_malaysianus.AAC.1